MIVDTEGPQDTQAEITGNNKTTEANVPPQLNPPDIDTEANLDIQNEIRTRNNKK